MAYFRGSTTVLKKSSESPGNEWVSQVGMRERHDSVAGSVYADKAGTLYIEQSSDGKDWDISASYEIAKEDGKGFTESLVLPYWRIRFVNTTNEAQGTFRISATTQAGGDS